MRVQDTPAGVMLQVPANLAEPVEQDSIEALDLPLAPIPPLLVTASGLYLWSTSVPLPAIAGKLALDDMGPNDQLDIVFPLTSERLCLDIDGRYPQMTASGTITRLLSQQTHWIAKLKPGPSPHQYLGSIWYKDGNVAAFPYTNVEILVTTSIFPGLRKAVAIFTGGGAASACAASNMSRLISTRSSSNSTAPPMPSLCLQSRRTPTPTGRPACRMRR